MLKLEFKETTAVLLLLAALAIALALIGTNPLNTHSSLNIWIRIAFGILGLSFLVGLVIVTRAAGRPQVTGPPSTEAPSRAVAAVLFSDVAGYGRLTEAQLVDFMRRILPVFTSEVIDKYRAHLIELNTWGDGILAASRDPYCIAHLALDIRDFFNNRNWREDHLPDGLSVRVALHAGVVYHGNEPIRQTKGITGSQVNLTARIQPITSPGQIFVSEQFYKMVDATVDPGLAFDDLGEVNMPHSFGAARLYRLRWRKEPKRKPLRR